MSFTDGNLDVTLPQAPARPADHVGRGKGIALGDYSNITVTDLARILSAAKASVGNGRFYLSVGDGSNPEDFFLMHRYHPTAYAFEEMKVVAKGSVDACIKALPGYIAAFPRAQTLNELAATLGIEPPRPVNQRPTLTGRGDLTQQATLFRALAGEVLEPFFRDGWQACVDGPQAVCPYKEGTLARHAWCEGWNAAYRYLSA